MVRLGSDNSAGDIGPDEDDTKPRVECWEVLPVWVSASDSDEVSD